MAASTSSIPTITIHDGGKKAVEEKYLVNFNSVFAKGGFGVVYRGKSRATGQEIVVKTINKAKFIKKEGHNAKSDVFGQLKLEFSVHAHAASLPEAKKYVGNFIEVFQDNEEFYVLMDFIPGGTLDQIIKRAGFKVPAPHEHGAQPSNCGVSEVEARKLLRDTLRAVDFMHSHHLMHRDLKPENLCFNPATGTLQLLDYGYARSVADLPPQTAVGTMQYVAPEILENLSGPKKPYTDGADIWSVGCIAVELVTGARPFPQGPQASYHDAPIWRASSAYSQLIREHMLVNKPASKRWSAKQLLEHDYFGGAGAGKTSFLSPVQVGDRAVQPYAQAIVQSLGADAKSFAAFACDHKGLALSYEAAKKDWFGGQNCHASMGFLCPRRPVDGPAVRSEAKVKREMAEELLDFAENGIDARGSMLRFVANPAGGACIDAAGVNKQEAGTFMVLACEFALGPTPSSAGCGDKPNMLNGSAFIKCGHGQSNEYFGINALLTLPKFLFFFKRPQVEAE